MLFWNMFAFISLGAWNHTTKKLSKYKSLNKYFVDCNRLLPGTWATAREYVLMFVWSPSGLYKGESLICINQEMGLYEFKRHKNMIHVHRQLQSMLWGFPIGVYRAWSDSFQEHPGRKHRTLTIQTHMNLRS